MPFNLLTYNNIMMDSENSFDKLLAEGSELF